jgi:hypothetical protein
MKAVPPDHVRPLLRPQREANCPDTAAISTTATMAASIRARPSRPQSRPTFTKQPLPRIVESTEPIICSGTVATPGRQSASAFATQHALRDANVCKFAGDPVALISAQWMSPRLQAGVDFVNFKFQNCAFGKAKRTLIN